MGSILVFAEHQHHKVTKATLVAIAAGKELAGKTGGECHAIILGKDVNDLASELAGYVSKVYAVSDASLENYVADSYASVLRQIAKDKGADTILATATAIGKDLLPRLAAMLDTGMASEVTAFNDDSATTCTRATPSPRVSIGMKVISVRATAFDPEGRRRSGQQVAVKPEGTTKFVSFSETKSDRPVLTDARIVVSGGRALKSGENFKTVLEPLVDALGAAMGASRAAVDAGYVPNDLQVGQTGKVVAPDLSIAVEFQVPYNTCRDEGLEGHRRHQQGRRGADLPGRRLRIGCRPVQSRTGDDGRSRKAQALNAGARSERMMALPRNDLLHCGPT
jgi:electron transfer flavoprotein alpha subunit